MPSNKTNFRSREELVKFTDELEQQELLVERLHEEDDFHQQEADQQVERLSELTNEYYLRLPVFSLSVCPFCGRHLDVALDPYGMTGFGGISRLPRK